MFDKHKEPEFLFTVVPTWVHPSQFPVQPLDHEAGTTLFLVPDAGEGKTVEGMMKSLRGMDAASLCFLRKLK